MDSRQSSTFEGVVQQPDEVDPPPPYHEATGETETSSQQANYERAASPLHPSRLGTENAAEPTCSPTPASQQNKPLEEIDCFWRGFRTLRLGLEQNPADWDRVAASVLIIHDQMISAESQLARLRRQQQADARLYMSLEQRLYYTHTRWLDAERRAAEAEAWVRELEKYGENLRAGIDSVLKRLWKSIGGKR